MNGGASPVSVAGPVGSGDERPHDVPLEHALALDEIGATVRPDKTVYVGTDSPSLFEGFANRHDRVVANPAVAEQVVVPRTVELFAVDAFAPDDLDRAVVLEPDGVETVVEAVQAADVDRQDCLVANPHSYNRVEDRSVSGWCSHRRVLRAYRRAGFETQVTGYHGPRSIARSAVGCLWSALGRPDARDLYTHRMRETYVERWWPLALGSCLVHVAATREGR